MADETKAAEPLPIWFFVGVILAVYGLLVLVAGFVTEPRQTVLAETQPNLWWGAILTVAGAVFTAIGLAGRRKAD
jgi:hypothetical protein